MDSNHFGATLQSYRHHRPSADVYHSGHPINGGTCSEDLCGAFDRQGLSLRNGRCRPWAGRSDHGAWLRGLSKASSRYPLRTSRSATADNQFRQRDPSIRPTGRSRGAAGGESARGSRRWRYSVELIIGNVRRSQACGHEIAHLWLRRWVTTVCNDLPVLKGGTTRHGERLLGSRPGQRRGVYCQ